MLVEKKNPILNSARESATEEHSKEVLSSTKKSSASVVNSHEIKRKPIQNSTARATTTRQTSIYSMPHREENNNSRLESDFRQNRSEKLKTISEKKVQPQQKKDDFFSAPSQKKSVIDDGIPVIRNKNLDNQVITSRQVKEDKKVFPDISLEKKENIFPSFPEINKSNSFFDEDEFKDLSNYMEDNKKNSWF